VTDPDTPISQLVNGFAAIAGHPIPYAQLPPRLRLHADRYTHWYTLAHHTPDTLAAQPKVGPSAVNAILAAARAAVAAASAPPATTPTERAQRALDQFDTDTQTLLTGRVLALDPLPAEDLAAALHCCATTITRRAQRAHRTLTETLTRPEHTDLHADAAHLAELLGPYIHALAAEYELRQHGLRLTDNTTALLLHIAGPYRRHHHWLENTSRGGHQQIQPAADTALTAANGAIPATDLAAALTDHGMTAHSALDYIRQTYTLTRIAGITIAHTDTSAPVMATAVLHAHARPLTIAEIHADIGPDTITAGTLGTALSAKPQFVRATRTTWALRQWQLPQYSGIDNAIRDHLAAHSGTAATNQLVAAIRNAYPDVTEKSIRSFISAPQYITQRGHTRLRRRSDPKITPKPLHTARGLYRTSPHEIRLALTVTHDHHRGSGHHIPTPVAVALGLRAGQRRTYTSTTGQRPITISWANHSINSTRIGSLRTHVNALGAATGDTLIIAIDTAEKTHTTTTLDTTATAAQQLAHLTGRDISDRIAALADALDNPGTTPHEALRQRGDHDAADLLDQALNSPTGD